MPTRLLHEKACESDTLAQLGAEAERLWWRLLTKADDYGYYDGRASVVLGQCFAAMLDRVGLGDVEAWLSELAGVGLIRRYTVEGRPYVAIERFEAYQNRYGNGERKAPKYPGPERADGEVRRMAVRRAPRAGAHASAPSRALAGDSVLDTRNSVLDTRGSGKAARPPKPVAYPTPPDSLKGFDAALRQWPTYAPTTAFYERVERQYGRVVGLDLEREAEKMIEWLLDNPSKARNRRDIPRFAERWLERALDDLAERAARRGRQSAGGNGYNGAARGLGGHGRRFDYGGPVSDEAREQARRAAAVD